MMEVTMYNSQDILEAVAWNIEKGVTTATIGTSVCSTLALFNHSCAPNLTKANVGSVQLYIATEDIMKGQEIKNYYQFQFHDKIISTRQPFLKDHYKFSCRYMNLHLDFYLHISHHFDLDARRVIRSGPCTSS